MAGDPQSEHPVFADLLRKHRLAANLTQEALAERAGLSARGISDLERGARGHPYRETVSMLISALGLSGAEQAAFMRAARRPGKPLVPTGSPGTLPPLPIPLNRLIGRSAELEALGTLLREEAVRLVTLTGPGGVGKTRLALAIAAAAGDSFPDGIVLVDLAPLRDPSRIPDKIAATLGLDGQKTASLLGAIHRYLAARRMLLVLDNFEHLLAAAPFVGAMLQTSPGVKALVTSREPLRLQGEREYAVSPLTLPDPNATVTIEEVAANPAVRLFVARAIEAAADFRLTAEHAAAIAAICRRLDGLPLAIELAAPRVKMLPPAALLERLERRLPVLATGLRDAPARQRTLRDAIAWSYDLLSPREQEVFRRLGVFVGGWSLDAAERVLGGGRSGSSLSGFELLASLVDKSLVQPVGDGATPRFTMLGTIQEFAADRLRESDVELEAGSTAHASFFVELAEGARVGLTGPDQVAWLHRLDADDANVLAALAWTIEHQRPEAAMRFASALWRYWATRGRLEEGRSWLERALARPSAGEADLTARAETHNALGNILGDMGEYRAARGHYEEALGLRRALGDVEGVAGALNNLGLIAAWLGEYADATSLHEESLELRRSLGDSRAEAQSLSNLGDVAMAVGHFTRAEAFQQESLLLREAARDAAGCAYARYNLGENARLRGDDEVAERLLREAEGGFDRLGDKLGIAYAHWSLGELASRQGDVKRAGDLLGLALATRRDTGDQRGIIECLEAVGVLALRHGDHVPGVQVLALADRQRIALACPMPPANRAEHDRAVAEARLRRGRAFSEEAPPEAEDATLDEAMDLVWDILERVSG